MENSPDTAAAVAEQLPDPAARYQGLSIGPGGQLQDPPPKFPGQSIELGGKTYIVPSLNLGQVKRLGAKMDALETQDDKSTAEYMDLALDLIEPAMRRNYPTLTRDGLEEMIDMNNLLVVMPAVLGKASMAKAAATEAK